MKRDRDALGRIRELSTVRQAVVLGVIVGLAVATLVLFFPYDPVETVAAISVGISLIGGAHWYATRHGMGDSSVSSVVRWFVDLRRPTRRDALASGAVVVASVSLTVLIGTAGRLIAGTPPATHGGAAGATGDVPLWVLVAFGVFAVVVGPFFEELVFRNGLQKISADVLGVAPAIVLASAIFAAFHVPAYGGLGQPTAALAIPLVSVFVDSLVYGYAYHRTGNVLVAMVGHGSHNALALVSLVV